MDGPTLAETDLNVFTGGDYQHRHRPGGCYTEGVR